MTRRINFTQAQKQNIADHIRYKTMTVTQLAALHGCHPKSINRVMDEMGVSRLPTSFGSTKAGESRAMLKLLKDNNVSYGELQDLLQARKALRTTLGTNKTPDRADRTAALFRPNGAQESHAVAS